MTLPVHKGSESSPSYSRPLLWLRVIATYLVVLYHAIRFFDAYPSDISLGHHFLNWHAESFSRFLTQWHMPLFFVMAGISLKFSLGRGRSFKDMVEERIRRLIIPFLCCIVIVVIPQLYTLDAYRFGFGNPFTLFGDFFWGGRFTWSHLWFLLFLFMFTVCHSPMLFLLQAAPTLNLPMRTVCLLMLCFFSLPFAAFSPFMSLFLLLSLLVIMTYLLIRKSDRWIILLAMFVLLFIVSAVSHIFGVSILAFPWGMFYAVVCSFTLLLPLLQPRTAGWVAVGTLLTLICFHIGMLSYPLEFPLLSKDGSVISGLQIADILYDIAHFAMFFSFGLCAAFYHEHLKVICGPFMRWSPLIVICAIPLAALTFPPYHGYFIINGNFPTYQSQDGRIFYHSGAWVWMGILSLLAHLLLRDPIDEFVEKYLARASMTLYTTHIFWVYVMAFPARVVMFAIFEWYWIPPLMVILGTLAVCHVFHHYIVLRSSWWQSALGVK